MKIQIITFAVLICISLQVNGQTKPHKKTVKKTTVTSKTAAKAETASSVVVTNPTTEQTATSSPAIANTGMTSAHTGLKFTFGVRAGIQNNALLLHQKSDELSATLTFSGTGFNFGGAVDARFSEHFSVQAQILGVSKSTSFSSQNKFTLITADVPLNFLYHEQGFYIGGGPLFSYGIKAEHDDKQGGQKYDLYGSTPSPILNLWKRLEIGGGVTMGYQFANGLSVNAVYNRGFSNVYKQPNDPQLPIDWVDTNTVSFALGYTFGR